MQNVSILVYPGGSSLVNRMCQISIIDIYLKWGLSKDADTGDHEKYPLDIHSLHIGTSHERSESARNFWNDAEDKGYLISAFKGKI